VFIFGIYETDELRILVLQQKENIIQTSGWEKPGGKRTLGGPRRRWDDNIKMNLKNWY